MVYCLKSHFALHTVLRQQFIGEVGKFITFRCQVSLGRIVPILLASDDFRGFMQKYTGRQWEDVFRYIISRQLHILNAIIANL